MSNSMSNKPKVVFISDVSSVSRYIACQLASSNAIELRALITEKNQQNVFQRFVDKVKKAYNKKRMVGVFNLIINMPYNFLYVRLQLLYCKKKLWGNKRAALPVDLPSHCYLNLNSEEVRQQLLKYNADFLLVYSVGILQPYIFRACGRSAINVHVGITPEYRGLASEFWALYKREYNTIGFTVHDIDEGIDTGQILLQRYHEASVCDHEYDLRLKTIKSMPSAVIDVLTNYDKIKACAQSVEGRQSRLYSRPSMFQYLYLHMRMWWNRLMYAWGINKQVEMSKI